MAGAGQGGGGQLTDEELYSAVFCGDVPAFREGSLAHTDSAQAYISLGQEAPSLETPPDDVQEAMALDPPASDLRVKWRRETQQEADERAAAEAKADPAARRKQAWAIRYAHLRLSHGMALHTKKRGQRVQFTAVRRVRLRPEVARALQRARTDLFLQGCYTWRVGGTENVDGYWRPLRLRVGQRAYKTSLLDNLLRAVRIH